ncbi:DUF4169 family protein [Sphingomonas quercus]|uniref:DUF4169 family protein n=1 Tax=Sphingomonas quercus TaxID=2842451 RepID=A0ABS6BLE3_9SPHN|nr:DUF4169 family protein [Sphingomonas quercus]MBU3078069.1 DUF4169 family protein [Sphingomonas quercus]
MGEVINLRMARKARARAEAAGKAEANRARHGRTAGDKARDQAEQERLRRTLDGARRDGED